MVSSTITVTLWNGGVTTPMRVGIMADRVTDSIGTSLKWEDACDYPDMRSWLMKRNDNSNGPRCLSTGNRLRTCLPT